MYLQKVINRLMGENMVLKQCIAHQNEVIDAHASIANAFAFDLARMELGSLPDRLTRDYEKAVADAMEALKLEAPAPAEPKEEPKLLVVP